LTPAMIDELLSHDPTFIRVSINSGSPAAHHALYRLGADAYGYIQTMVSHMLRRTRDHRLDVTVDPDDGLAYAPADALRRSEHRPRIHHDACRANGVDRNSRFLRRACSIGGVARRLYRDP